MNVAAMAFMFLAVAASGGALTFLMGQRSSGRTASGVEESQEHALLLESVSKDLEAFHEDLVKTMPVADGHEEIKRACLQLEEAISGLRRGADLVL